MAKIGAAERRAMEERLLLFAAMFTRPSCPNAAAQATGALLCLNLLGTVCGCCERVDG